jgi:hypothetical protein
MRRKTNRVFRYFFPAAMVGTILFLLTEGSSKDAMLETAQAKETATAVPTETQAKMLKLVSHNPLTQARLFVNAHQAIQANDKITLNNPVGTFEKPEGPSSLTSTQASYYEAERKVHFFEKVNFDHYSGLKATTEYAVLNTQTQDITGDQGIKACHHKNTITANAYEIQPEQSVVCFKGDVCLSVSRRNS